MTNINEGWWRKMSKGFLLVISGPSGCGKGTVSQELLKRNKNIIFSISATTRKPRPNEINGVNYFFPRGRRISTKSCKQ